MDALFGTLLVLGGAGIVVLWGVFFPDTVTTLKRRVAGAGRLAAGRAGTMAQSSSQAGQQAFHQTRGGFGQIIDWVIRQRVALFLLSVAFLTPAILILVFHHGAVPEAKVVTMHNNVSAVVTRLLQDDNLAPPPPLPPDVFVSESVKKAAPQRHLEQANRNWDLLNATFRQRLLVVFHIMQSQYGYHMVMIEGYRSRERQAQLASKGSDVTQAGPGQSYHQYGLAADCAFYRNGQLVISAKSDWAMRGYQLYGQVAESVGMVWGGSWTSIKDLGHVEMHIPGLGPYAS